jgi:tRNA(Ile)-lysidine synthase
MNFDNIQNFLGAFRGCRIGVGFSGGADSTALLLLLNDCAKELKLKLTAVHFEHGIRGKASIDDAAWCKTFCNKQNIQFKLVSLNVPANIKSGENTESCARRMRLDYWRQFTSKTKPTIVALGHHNGDAVENLFIRLCRGANASGLTSLRRTTVVAGITFIRPLLEYKKTELTALLHSRGIRDWREDASNNDTQIIRNFFRQEIIPAITKQLPPAENGITTALNNLQVDADFIEKCAAASFEEHCGDNITTVDFWLNLDAALLPRVLRLWFSRATGTDFIPNGSLVEQFKMLVRQSARRRSLKISPEYYCQIASGNCSVKLFKKKFESKPLRWQWQQFPELELVDGIKLTAATFKSVKNIKNSGDAVTVYFDAGAMPAEIDITPRQNGDRMVPFGAASEVKLKKIIIDAKPAEHLREHIWVLRCGDKIIWVPGIRRANCFPLTPATKKILRLKVSYGKTSD